ncbi:efflux RND transporter periplasmic adaptor subunit [Colwellia sp. KU-HH00111]|uniref:efflux RND transporter periplasmic adaptor subunit n=1 Tax=Colwellia sp. KU-HH00111 TaxID=3127652 RepID=UPI00310B8904
MSSNPLSNHYKVLLVGLALGAIIGVIAYKTLTSKVLEPTANLSTVERKPLYWVAPMDANYKRDKPGKSPMGMDLVAVYDDTGKESEEGVGTIRISPHVVNNLGVRTSVVSVKALQTEINTVGYVTYDEDRLVHIHPRVQGWVEKLHVSAVGDPVKKDQPLYEIYSPELVNAQEEFLLALDRNNRRLINAAKNRLTALQLPKSAIEQLQKNRKVQQRITFYAPQNGVVENLKIREGYFVKPGSTLMSIGDLSEVWVEAEVFERQAGQVKTGTPVTMTLDYLPGKAWQGQVDYIYPTLDAKTRTVKVRLRFNNDQNYFKPNMFAQIAIHTTGDGNALLIPKEALIRTGNQDRVVLALGEGSFKSVAVSVGRYDSEHVEILAGLSEGEKVVSSAQFLLDSESSKSSDFKRMTTIQTMDEASETMDMSLSVPSATVHGTVVSVMTDHRMVTIDREAIAKWDRPAQTVDFIVDDSAETNVDMTLFTVGAYVMFTFEIRDGNFIIVSAMSMEQAKGEGELP